MPCPVLDLSLQSHESPLTVLVRESLTRLPDPSPPSGRCPRRTYTKISALLAPLLRNGGWPTSGTRKRTPPPLADRYLPRSCSRVFPDRSG